jgi:hypothetical protein
MEDFHVHPGLCIEFGVWHGYSTAALANHFERVIGADVFYGDVIPGTEGTPMIETTRKSLAPWKKHRTPRMRDGRLRLLAWNPKV